MYRDGEQTYSDSLANTHILKHIHYLTHSNNTVQYIQKTTYSGFHCGRLEIAYIDYVEL